MTEQELRQQVVAQARRWLGRKEADRSHREIIDVYNRIRPLPRGYRMSYTDPWCAAFVSAVGAECGLTAVLLPECSCGAMIGLYRKAGRWRKSEKSVSLQPGDLIFYDWNEDDSADHVGIVTERYGDGFRLIEGNVGDAVAYRTVRPGTAHIRGFALPDYAGQAADDNIADNAPMPPFDSADSFMLTFQYLKVGSTGEEVRAVQRDLKAMGFDLGRYGLDGSFGYDTRNAVIAYQRSVGLDADGVVGPKTMAALTGVSV